MKATLLSLVLLSVQAAAQLFSQLSELTDGNFEQTVVPRESSMWLVSFYVPWCPHAQAIAPKVEAAAKDLKARRFDINFGAVNVESNPKLGSMFSIASSPTVKLISFDQEGRYVIDDFTGSGDEVGSFCTEKYQQKNIPYTALPSEYGDGDVITLDDANFDEIVSSSNEIWMIKFGAPWCYHCNVVKPKWANVAKELGGKVRFATIDADKNRGLAKRFKISKLPTLRYYNAGYGKTDENVLSYTGKREEKPILEFATNLHQEYLSSKPIVQAAPEPLKPAVVEQPVQLQAEQQAPVPQSLHHLCDDDSLCVVAFLPQGGYQQSQVGDMSQILSDLNGQSVKLFWVEAGLYAECESILNLRAQEPQVIAFRAHESRFATMPQQYSYDGMKQFIAQVQGQGLEAGLNLPEGGIQLLGH